MKVSSEPYGYALAEKAFEYLVQHGTISYNHYGYCGVGFAIVEGAILYTHFDEWLTYREGTQYIQGGDYIGIIKTFYSNQEFIAWLSDQSDLSLFGAESDDPWYTGNQRINKERLLNLLARQSA